MVPPMPGESDGITVTSPSGEVRITVPPGDTVEVTITPPGTGLTGPGTGLPGGGLSPGPDESTHPIQSTLDTTPVGTGTLPAGGLDRTPMSVQPMSDAGGGLAGGGVSSGAVGNGLTGGGLGGGGSAGGGYSGGGGLGGGGLGSGPGSPGSGLDGLAADPAIPATHGDIPKDGGLGSPANGLTVKPVSAPGAAGVGGGQIAALGATALGGGLLGGSGAYAASRKARENNADGSELLDPATDDRVKANDGTHA
jgi:hypothetical protein